MKRIRTASYLGRRFFTDRLISRQRKFTYSPFPPLTGGLVGCYIIHRLNHPRKTIYIAAWNGSVWSNLGAGITNGTNVFCMAVWNGDLYVGGSFTEAGGVPANNMPFGVLSEYGRWIKCLLDIFVHYVILKGQYFWYPGPMTWSTEGRNDLRLFLPLFCAFLYASASLAGTIHVPGDSATIQAAINGCNPGDTVLVAEGTYTGDGNWDISFGGKAITVASENGPELTIVDCEYTDLHRGFVFENNEDSLAVLDGFTIRHNGVQPGFFGGGILCEGVSPTIKNCILTECNAYAGGGLGCRGGAPTLIGCRFIQNHACNGGAVAFWNVSSAMFIDCIFDANVSDDYMGGAVYCGNGMFAFINCTFTSNTGFATINYLRGGAIYCDGGAVYINGSVFADNRAQSGGAIFAHQGASVDAAQCTFSQNGGYSGSAIYIADTTSASIQNSIIAFGKITAPVFCDGESATVDLDCCDIYGNDGGDWVGCIAGEAGTDGNFSSDPLFCDTSSYSYYLNGSSSCIPAHNSCEALVGAYEVGCNYNCGDANGDGQVNVGDAVFQIACIFKGGADPSPFCVGDANGADGFNVGDVVYLIAYVFKGGPPPVETCCR